MRTLDGSDRQSLLAEALATHGTALARLRRYDAALATFQRAIAVCERIGAISRAAHIALAMVQELGEWLTVADNTRPISGRTLSEELRALEHDLIEQALEQSEAHLTKLAIG